MKQSADLPVFIAVNTFADSAGATFTAAVQAISDPHYHKDRGYGVADLIGGIQDEEQPQ